MNKKTAFPISKEVRSYLEGLLSESGMDVIPPDVREKMIAELAQRLDAKLTIAAIAALPDKKLAEFEKLFERDPKPTLLSQFFSKNVPNPGKVYNQALNEFRANYLGQ